MPTNRDPYEWVPRASCALPPLERTAVCALLSGLRVVLVGDSTLAMVFHSLALALRARTQMDTSGGRRVAHVACGPHAAPVTVVSLRNDLLLQDTPQDKKVVRSHRLEWFRKAPWLKEGGNLTILGAGLHDVGSDGSDKIEPGFYARHLAAAIRSSGPSRTAAVAIAAPQPGCSRFTAPLPLSRARLLANNASAADSPYLAQWRVWAQRPALVYAIRRPRERGFLPRPHEHDDHAAGPRARPVQDVDGGQGEQEGRPHPRESARLRPLLSAGPDRHARAGADCVGRGAGA